VGSDRSSAAVEDLARAYIDALEAKDKEAILSMLADDFVMEMPFDTAGTNDLSNSWGGIETASVTYEENFAQVDFVRFADVEIFPARDPTVAFAEARGVVTTSSGRPYENRYVLRFEALDGRITRIREYLNPVTAAISFGLPLPQVDA
jgi:uncharacterized protein